MSAEQWQKRFEWPIAIAALAVIPILIIEDSDAGGAWPAIGAVLNWCSWGVFLAEIVVMLSVVRDRRAWLLQHPLDVAIVVLTPPFVPLLGVRLLRLLRVLRLLVGGVKLNRLLSLDGIRLAGVFVLTVVIAGRRRIRRRGIPAGALDLGRRLVGGHHGDHRRLRRNRGPRARRAG